MKKRLLAALLTATMVLSLTACGGAKEEAAAPAATEEAAPAAEAEAPAAEEAAAPAAEATGMDALIEAAKAEGALTVYGSCEEAYLSAACQKFEELYGIPVDYQRLSTGEVYTKISEEAGNPSADVWFGGTTDPYNEASTQGLLSAYEAKNASHLLGDAYRDADGYW